MKHAFERVVDRLYSLRLLILIFVHILLTVTANQGAFWLRFDGVVPPEQQPYDAELLPLLVLTRLAVFLPLRLHQGVWRYAGIWDLRRIAIGVSLSSAVFWLVVHRGLGLTAYPRSVFIIDGLLLLFLMGGVRLLRRFNTGSSGSGATRVLIYGAGDSGEMIARDMLARQRDDCVPVAFVDDSPNKHGLDIHGLPVFRSTELDRAVRLLRPNQFVIAMPTAEPKAIRRVLNSLSPFGIPIKTVPRLRELAAGEQSVTDVRDLSVADLLSRPPVGLDAQKVLRMVASQTVLVTGAGGSIGSELCRQIAYARPARLILVDQYENNLFAVHAELSRQGHKEIVPLIADITDERRLEQLFERHRPSLVFHAAAHKHVPLMESNPSEAIKNNVRGTRLLAEMAIRHHANKFVLVSTDKAVNPSSVMGASKRLAELVIQRLQGTGGTQFRVVRFGNVLGSNGSVVPTFLEQIKNGGPVTITHPEMRRYFMLIPEAVQLVLHAAAMDGDGGTYVLEMGEQIRIVDMARDLIRLAGYVPDDDIEILFTGIRPGEKLAEELVGPGEEAWPSDVDKVLRVRTATDHSTCKDSLAMLESLAIAGDDDAVLKTLAEMLPSFATSQPCQTQAAV